MIKQSIRLVGCIIALFALILVFKHSHLMQEEKPLNTTERFNIAVLSTTISKERLVNELNALVDQYGAVLVKVVPNQDNYDSQKDIIWFGSLQPDGTSPRIRDNRISWLEPSVGGELIHSSDMGVRPLYGSYSMLGSTEFKVALAEWCNKNEMSIDFYKQYPLPAVFLVYFIQHGIGNAVLISFFLFLTTVIVWFVTHAKARTLRLLGGVPLQRIHFEDKQLPIWTNTGEIQPEGMGFCEFNGGSFLVLPPNASYGNSTIQAKNPLIILVEEPVKTLKVSSFLLPMSSSGNIVFKNEDVLRSVLNESPLMEKISSIDSFTEGALKYAQLFKQESFYYFAACALCLVSMGAAGIMSAQLWIGENRKRIFTLHTAGIKYSAIILPVLRKEVIVAVCTVLVGGIVVYSIRHPEPLLLLLSSAVLFLMYVLLNFVGYIFFSKREFLQMSFRRE